jgi:2-oxoglutarate ferredoxin oxidoreductase subunit beta
MPELGVARENTVFVSGIGCSSRFPYYMNTYGFHSIHGRAPAIATGLKVARPDLAVWVITGDGDGLSIGGNHLIHALRRNVGLKILLFNNRIYGLTKGQYSPTSERGKVTKSTPMGSIDYPFNPISVALGSNAAFVARSIDVEASTCSQSSVLAALGQRSSRFCRTATSSTMAPSVADRQNRKADTQLVSSTGTADLRKESRQGIRMHGQTLEAVTLGGSITESDLIVHDETDQGLAFFLSQVGPPDFPTPVGVFRAVNRPTYEQMMVEQVRGAKGRLGGGNVENLLHDGDTWTVS